MAAKKARKATSFLVTRTAKRKPKSKLKTRHARAPRALELQLRRTVAELGLTEARKIFAAVEAAFGD